MNKSTTPPNKHAGGGIFILAALAMVATTGGLLYWKLGGDPEPEPEIIASSKKAESPKPKFVAPPPPPPPEEEEEKPEEKKKPTSPVKRASGPQGCGAKECMGDATPALRSKLRAVAGQARSCYERALRQNSMLQGKLLVSMRLSPTGAVCSAGIAQNSLGDPGVGSCVVQKLRGAAYPAPKGGCVDTQVPLNFVPKQ